MRRAAAATLALVAVATLAAAPSPWPAALPALRLADPLGTEFTEGQWSARGAVVVVTAPNLSQGGAQQAWTAAFDEVKREGAAPMVVFVEDMSQSYFRPVVISRMKAAYRPGSGLLVLLDESGDAREALGVSENATVAFAFGPGGKLRAVETGAASAERAEALLRSARGH